MPDNGQVDQIGGWNGGLIPVGVDQSIKSSTAQGGNGESIFLFERGRKWSKDDHSGPTV